MECRHCRSGVGKPDSRAVLGLEVDWETEVMEGRWQYIYAVVVEAQVGGEIATTARAGHNHFVLSPGSLVRTANPAHAMDAAKDEPQIWRRPERLELTGANERREYNGGREGIGRGGEEGQWNNAGPTTFLVTNRPNRPWVQRQPAPAPAVRAPRPVRTVEVVT